MPKTKAPFAQCQRFWAERRGVVISSKKSSRWPCCNAADLLPEQFKWFKYSMSQSTLHHVPQQWDRRRHPRASVDKQGLSSNPLGLVFFFVQHLKVASWQMIAISDTSNQYVLRFNVTGYCWNQAGSILSQLYQKLYLYIIKYAFKCFSTGMQLVCGCCFFCGEEVPLSTWSFELIDCWALTDTCTSVRSCSLEWLIDHPASPLL